MYSSHSAQRPYRHPVPPAKDKRRTALLARLPPPVLAALDRRMRQLARSRVSAAPAGDVSNALLPILDFANVPADDKKAIIKLVCFSSCSPNC